MTRHRFRFRPPPIAAPPALRWVLAAAFSERAPEEAPADTAAALDLSDRLALTPRLATREDRAVGTADGPASVLLTSLRTRRALAVARELRLDATLARVAAAAEQLGVGLAVLKGRAVTLGGYATAGARPSGDIDLLVEEGGLDALGTELRRRGFAAEGSTSYEHHAAALLDPEGVSVELHRTLPGVRLDGRRSADWRSLASRGLLEALPPGASFPSIRVPSRDVLVAHALVHALAQHGLSTSYPGWLLIGDLIDLRASAADGGVPAAWTARDLAPSEIGGALDLAALLASGGDPFAPAAPREANLLARHFTACALDATYAEALKTRWLESPIGEGHPAWARLRVLRAAFVPPGGGVRQEGVPGALRRIVRWLERPFRLAAKALRARRASREIAKRARADGG